MTNEAQRIEEAIERINCGHWGSEHIQTLIDLARSYLSAIQSGVPEEIRINQAYHHLCYGGGTCRMLDCWSDKETITCKFSGDRNWATPSCECCNGKHTEKEKSIYNQEREQGFNACRSQMLALIVERDREIAELEKSLGGWRIDFLKLCKKYESLSARVRDVEGITDVLTSVYLPTDEVMTADGRKQKCLLTTYARMFATAISAWLQEGK